jgi:hypothetical protein
MVDPFPAPPADEPAEAFAAVVALRRLAASLERSAVDSALGQGWTWAQIGEAAPSKRSPLTEETR